MANIKKSIVILNLFQDPSHLIRSFSAGLLLCLLLFAPNISGLTVGSDTIASYQREIVIFPNYDTDNQMLSLGSFQNGFALQDATTTCTFASTLPVLGSVGLHGGTLYLDANLIFQNITYLNSSGYF